MEADFLKQALQEAGWQASFAFPTASTENIKLLDLLSESRAKLYELTDDATLYREKNEKLKDHIQLIKNERKLSEDLKLEMEKETDHLKHVIKLAEQENWRTASDNKKLKKQKKAIVDRLGALEDEIFLKSNQLTSIKGELDCDQKLIERYLDKCEGDVELRKRVKIIGSNDSTHINFLCSEESRLNQKRAGLRQKLDMAVSKNEVIQLRIDNAADISRAENRGRREMLQLWENTVAQMSARDEAYANLSQEYDVVLGNIHEMTGKLREAEEVLASVKQDIQDLKKQSDNLNKVSSDLRGKIFTENDEIATLEGDLLTQRKALDKTVKELEAAKATIKYLKSEENDKNAEIADMCKIVKRCQEKLDLVHSKKLSTEELLRLMEQQLESENECQRRLHVKLEKLKKKNKAEFELKTIEALIAGSRNLLRAANNAMKKSETELEKLDRLIYNAMLNAHQLEQRIAKMEDVSASDEETVALEKRIKVLQDQLNARTRSSVTLVKMTNQFLNEKRIIHMRIEKIKEELQLLANQMDNTQVTLASTKRSLDASTKMRNELLVVFNMSRYQLRRAETRLKMTAEATVSAEMQFCTLNSLTRELQEESSANNYRIEMDLRQANADRSRVNADFVKRKQRLNQLITRYKLAAVLISSEEGDLAGGKAQFIVKSLEEHEELRARGDELDKEVRVAEEELRALENTVFVMSSLNESARSFCIPAASAQMQAEKEKLVKTLDDLEKLLKQARENRRIFRASVLRFTVELQRVDEDIDEQGKTAASHESDILHMSEKNTELEVKLDRANKAQSMARHKAGRVKQQAELDIAVQLICDFNESMNMLLARSIRASPFTNDDVLRRAQELSDTFQLTTPILLGNVANIKASEKLATSARGSNNSSSVTQMKIHLNTKNFNDEISFPVRTPSESGRTQTSHKDSVTLKSLLSKKSISRSGTGTITPSDSEKPISRLMSPITRITK